jgi:hypothetical protein
MPFWEAKDGGSGFIVNRGRIAELATEAPLREQRVSTLKKTLCDGKFAQYGLYNADTDINTTTSLP